MLSFRLSCVLVLVFLDYINCQRRIKDGVNIKGDKNYMVYLVQAKSSIRNYNGWICGGSIVSHWYILTSAACVEDVQSMYAISGTRTYISATQIFANACTHNTMKKIVFTCVPKEYELDFGKVENWSFNDIAIVKVETPYDFEGTIADTYCNYKPNAIKINFDVKHEQAGTDVIVLGYGHSELWREQNVNDDLNNSQMQYSSSKIHSLEKCKNVYKQPDLFNNIDKFMICTNGSGVINEDGNPSSNLNDFMNKTQNKRTFRVQLTRKQNNFTFHNVNRRHGFCQNDHGGPLVAWINGVETVVGVASVFRVNKERKCTGPYLYTSTARNRLFIECIMNDQMSRRSTKCDQPPSERGFTILRRYILWNENKEHVADNQEIRIRPQINMNFVGNGR